MPALLSRNYFITNLKISHSTRISLKFVVNTQFLISMSAFADPRWQEVSSVVDFGIRTANCWIFQIKPCKISHCKPSKNCRLHYFFFFLLLLLYNLENVHSIETMKRRCRVQTAQPSPVVHIHHPVFELHWCLLGRRGDPRRVLPHHNPFASISATLSGPLGEYSATKAATQNLSLRLVAKDLLLVLSFSSVLSKTDTLKNKIKSLKQ